MQLCAQRTYAICSKVKEIKSIFYTVHNTVVKRKLNTTLAKILGSI